MSKSFLPYQLNFNHQDAGNSSSPAQTSGQEGQPWFDSVDPGASDWNPQAFTSDATGFNAWNSGAATNLQWDPTGTGSSAPFLSFPLLGSSAARPTSGASASNPNAFQALSAAAAQPASGASGSPPGGSPPTAAASGPTTSGGGTTVSTSGSGLVFVNTYDASCTAAYEACIVAAEDELESLFTNSVTINLTFKEADTAPTTDDPNPDAATNNWSGWTTVTYAQLEAALPATDVLPSTDPNPTGTWYLPEAYARMLGLSTNAPATDDTVTLNSYYDWDFSQDVINSITHEITEGGLGRVGGTGDQNGVWSTMDLFRYTAAGALDDTDGRDGETTYFSSDGGETVSDQNDPDKGAPTLSFNNEYNSSGTQVNTGDTADWTQLHIFGSTSTGETLTLDQTELDVMEALGWHLSLKQDVYEAASGVWEAPTNWSTGAAPITPQDAYIGGASGTIAVSLNADITINSIATSAEATLTIGANAAVTLIAIEGTVLNTEDSSSVASGNLGNIDVEPGSALQIGDTFDNAGTLAIGKGADGSGDNADLYIYDTLASVTLDGGGALTLGQAADASAGEIETYADILNAPGTSGNGLTNVDNTISGGGRISLYSFDNQADGKVEATQTGSAAYWLQISASTFTNEGFMAAEAGATLRLGGVGDTETLTNAGNGANEGVVGIYSGARLAISGDFTAAGAGSIAFKGAGAEITSDAAAATTFTNESTIALETSLSSSDFSGQIGDQGLLSVNDLTFVNDGTTLADGAGNALVINTGAITVVNGASGQMGAGNGATLTIASNLNNAGFLEAGTSSSSSYGASTGTLDLGEDGDIQSMTNTGEIAIFAGSDLAISGAYTVSAGAGGDASSIVFKGAGGAITSDEKGPTELLNESSIVADYSAQIGDAGLAANDLQFENDFGSVTASGAGVTLTLNTGSYSIIDQGGTIEAENSATIAIDSNVDTGEPSGSGGTIEAGPGGVIDLSANVAAGYTGMFVPGQVVVDGGTLNVLLDSSVSVSLNEESGTISIAGGDTLTLSGADSLSGAVIGAGELAITGGDTVLSGGASLTVAAFTVSGATTTLSVTGDVSIGAALTESSGTISIASGDTLTLSGADSLSGAVIGAGELAIAGHETIVHSGANLSVAKLSISGGGTTLEVGAIPTYSGAVTESSGTLSIANTDTLSLTGTNSLSGTILSAAGELAIAGDETIIHTGAKLETASLLVSGGGTTLEVGAIPTYAGAVTESSGTVTIANTDTLSLTGTNSLSGTILSAAGELAFAGADSIIHSGAKLETAKLLISGGSTQLEVGTIPTYAGAITEASGTLSIANADTLSLTGANSFSGTIASAAGELAFTGGDSIIHTGAKLQTASLLVSGASTQLLIGTIPTYAGAVTESSGTLSIANSDTLSLTGTNSFSGTVSSAAGELAIAGGNTTIHTGASLAVSAWSILGASTEVMLDEALTYSGAFSLSAGTLDLSGGALGLSGSASLTGGTVDGSSFVLLLEGTSPTTISGLTVSGSAELNNVATANQTGQVTLGGSTGTAGLNNAATGVYDLLGNVGFSEGASNTAYINNDGLLEKTAGTGISTIKPNVSNGGTIKVSDGELVLQGALTGTGTDTIAGAATLKFDSTVASGQSVTFTGNGGLLNLGSPQGFSGDIKDFDLGGATNDAIDIASGWTFTGATVGASSTTLGFTEGSTHISLTLQGAYTGTFNSAAISSGTQITYAA